MNFFLRVCEKVPFGYEQKLTFENFRFHTLGMKKSAVFSLFSSLHLSKLGDRNIEIMGLKMYTKH